MTQEQLDRRIAQSRVTPLSAILQNRMLAFRVINIGQEHGPVLRQKICRADAHLGAERD